MSMTPKKTAEEALSRLLDDLTAMDPSEILKLKDALMDEVRPFDLPEHGRPLVSEKGSFLTRDRLLELHRSGPLQCLMYLLQVSIDCRPGSAGEGLARALDIIWRTRGRLRTSKPDWEKAEADQKLFDSGVKIEEIAKRNNEPYGTTKKRRERHLKRLKRKKGT